MKRAGRNGLRHPPGPPLPAFRASEQEAAFWSPAARLFGEARLEAHLRGRAGLPARASAPGLRVPRDRHARIGRQQPPGGVQAPGRLGLEARGARLEPTGRRQARRLRPEPLRTARGGAPRGARPKREAPSPGAGSVRHRGAHAPFLITALAVGEQAPRAQLRRQGPRGPADRAAGLHPRRPSPRRPNRSGTLSPARASAPRRRT